MPPEIDRLHVITGPPTGRDPLDVVAAALRGGAGLIQVRAKQGTDRERLAFTEAVVARCRAAGARCLVNDRVDLALAAGADGVHVGADDLPVAAARELLGPAAIVGATARDPATGQAAERAGASYLGVGPVHATETKAGLPDPLGDAGVARVAAAVAIPVIAISGLTATTVPAVVAAGAHGIAVIGAVWRADDPEAATRALAAALRGTS